MQPVYTRVEESRASPRMGRWVAVLALVVAMAPAPSSLSLALHVDVAHQHPVDLEQWSQRSPGDVRCYCNLPACITTGYMCKSAGRGCFSDLVDHVDVYRARHGCLDLLDAERQRQCKNQPRLPADADLDADADADDDVPAWEQDGVGDGGVGDVGDLGGGVAEQDTLPEDALPEDAAARQDAARVDTPSLLLCCAEDMCNHIDGPDSRARQTGPNGSDAAHVTMSSPAGVPLPPGAGAGPGSSSAEAAAAAAAATRSAELWFKAATIAVPICGALILVLLIVLAVRLLRADSQHQRASKLSACAFPPMSDKKVPLLACGVGHGLGHGVGSGWGLGVNRLGSVGSVVRVGPDVAAGGSAGAAPPKNHTLAKLNYSASYGLLDLDLQMQQHSNNHSNNHSHPLRNVMLGNVPGKSSYKQVLASFVPWAGGRGGGAGAAEGADPPTNV